MFPQRQTCQLSRFLFAFLARVPLPLLHAFGSLFGFLALARRKHRRILRENLGMTGMAGQVGLAAIAAGLGRGILEVVAIWLRPLAKVTALVREVRGLEHLEAARQRGKGLLLLAPHLGCWELAGIWYGARHPMTALYRPPRQSWVHIMMKAGRERGQIRTVPPDRGGVKALLAALKRNEAAFILPDQVANRGADGVWIRFFGQPAYVPVLPYRLAAATGAAVLVLVCERLPNGRGYRLHITPLDNLPEDPAEAATRVHAAIADFVRAMPDQYLWSYRFFRRKRSQPPLPEAL